MFFERYASISCPSSFTSTACGNDLMCDVNGRPFQHLASTASSNRLVMMIFTFYDLRIFSINDALNLFINF